MDSPNLEIRSDTRAPNGMRRALLAWLSEREVPGTVIDVLPAGNEAAANAVLAGGVAGTFEVPADVDGCVRVTAADRGRWVTEGPTNDEGGRRLVRMRAHAARVDLARTTAGTPVSLRFPL